jgi:hypothetical protein
MIPTIIVTSGIRHVQSTQPKADMRYQALRAGKHPRNVIMWVIEAIDILPDHASDRDSALAAGRIARHDHGTTRVASNQ